MQESIRIEIEAAFSSLENRMAPRSIVFAGKHKAEKQAMLAQISAEVKERGFSCCTFDTMQAFASGDIWEQFLKIGEAAQSEKKPVCVFIGELQQIPKERLGELLMAIHRSNQLNYPVMFFCTGSPKIAKKLVHTKSYAERLFAYFDLGESVWVSKPTVCKGV